MKLFLQLGRVD